MGQTQPKVRQLKQSGATNNNNVIKWDGSDWAPAILTSANLSDFTEAVQDIMGAILADSDTINYTYTDLSGTITTAVRTQLSVTSDASGLKLEGDTLTPGANKIYGTNGSGDKGWFNSPSGADGNGIYSGSGNIGNNVSSSSTVAKIPGGTSSFSIAYSNLNTAIEIFNSVSNSQITLSNRPLTYQFVIHDLDMFLSFPGGTVYMESDLITFQDATALFTNTTATPDAKALVDIFSTDKALMLPRFDGTQFTAYDATPTNDGMVLYNTSTDKLMLRANNVWVDITTGSPILTASNGLTKTGTNVEWGGVLTEATTIDNANTYNTTFSGSFTANLLVVNNAATSGAGISTTSAGGTGIIAQATNSGLGGQFITEDVATNVLTALSISRNVTTGIGADNIGVGLEFAAETTTSQNTRANALISQWSTATHAGRRSKFSITSIHDAAESNSLEILSTGQLVLPKYGDNTFTGTATRYLQVDTNGLVIEGPITGVGGIYSGSGTIAAAAVATVTLNSSFKINYNGGVTALGVEDNNLTAYLRSKNASGFFTAENSLTSLGLGSGIMTFNGSQVRLRTNPFYVDIPNGNAYDSSAAFQVDSTTGSILVPRMTTVNRDAIATPANGSILYNTTTGKFTIREGGAWKEFTAASGIYGGSGTIPTATVATLASSGTFTFDWSTGSDAMLFTDGGLSPGIVMTSKDAQNSFTLSDDAVFMRINDNNTIVELLPASVRLAYDEGGSNPQEFQTDVDGFKFNSLNKMLVIPRMTTAQRTAIVSPIEGGILYNTSTQKLTYRNNTTYIEVANAAAGNGGIYGGSGTVATTVVATLTDSFKIKNASGNDAIAITGNNDVLITSNNGTAQMQTGNSGTTLSFSSTALQLNGTRTRVLNPMFFDDAGNPLGTAALLDLSSTTKVFYPPRMLTTEKNAISPDDGAVIYDTDTDALSVRSAGAWVSLVSSGGGIALSSITAATADTTVDHTNKQMTWNWSTATNHVPLKFTANGLTSGTIAEFTTSNASLNTTNGIFRVMNTGASQNGKLAVFGANNGTNTGMTWLTNGKVGIGEAAPAVGLHVVGNSGIRAESGILHSKSTGNDFTTVETASALRLENTTATNGRTWYLGSRNDGNLRIGNQDNPYIDIQKTTGMLIPFNSIALPGVSSSLSIAANTNNWDPNPNQDTTVWLVSATGAFNITGINNSYQGRIVYLINTGANLITLKKDDANSTDLKRILMRADVVLGQDNVVQLWYDVSAASGVGRWRVISQN